MLSFFEAATNDVVENKYNNMSLDEACYEARADLAEFYNEERIETLCYEYAYLIENGKEVDYTSNNIFNEAEDGEKDGEKVNHFKMWLDKVGRWFKAFLAQVKQIFDRFLLWVSTNVKSFVNKLGIDKSKIDQYIGALANADNATKRAIVNKIKFFPSGEKFFDLVKDEDYITDLDKAIPETDKAQDAIDKIGAVKANRGLDDAQAWAASAVYRNSAKDMIVNGYKNYAKKLLTTRKEMDKKLTENYKKLKNIGNPSDADIEKINRYPKALNHNMKVVHKYVKLWSDFTKYCLLMVKAGKAVVKSEKAEKKIVGDAATRMANLYK